MTFRFYAIFSTGFYLFVTIDVLGSGYSLLGATLLLGQRVRGCFVYCKMLNDTLTSLHQRPEHPAAQSQSKVFADVAKCR